ncbi:MAG: hypothetical protein JJU29_14885 [Verrucomicrobia bacterium]|nr:hypothetical protein [Verrucomicrobiota bacterium]MCH8513272.1 hypothetical protein [Kiritimatiellia bacterium]
MKTIFCRKHGEWDKRTEMKHAECFIEFKLEFPLLISKPNVFPLAQAGQSLQDATHP